MFVRHDQRVQHLEMTLHDVEHARRTHDPRHTAPHHRHRPRHTRHAAPWPSARCKAPQDALSSRKHRNTATRTPKHACIAYCKKHKQGCMLASVPYRLLAGFRGVGIQARGGLGEGYSDRGPCPPGHDIAVLTPLRRAVSCLPPATRDSRHTQKRSTCDQSRERERERVEMDRLRPPSDCPKE